MLDQLCAELFYEMLPFLDFESLVGVRHSASWLCRRLEPRGCASARQFWAAYEETRNLFVIFLDIGLAAAKFLCGAYGLPMIVADAGYGQHNGPYLLLMHAACRSGDLAKLRWVTHVFPKHFDMPGRLSFDNSHRAPLWMACEHGHLNVARWLADDYAGGVTGTAAREWERYNGDFWLPELLALVCARGHLDVAQWLVRRFEMDAGELDWAIRQVVSYLRSGAPDAPRAAIAWLAEECTIEVHC
jgi:hypothetical protein